MDQTANSRLRMVGTLGIEGRKGVVVAAPGVGHRRCCIAQNIGVEAQDSRDPAEGDDETSPNSFVTRRSVCPWVAGSQSPRKLEQDFGGGGGHMSCSAAGGRIGEGHATKSGLKDGVTVKTWPASLCDRLSLRYVP